MTHPTPNQRARADFVPMCPYCSFVSIPEQPDILHRPMIREVRFEPTFSYPNGRTVYKIDRCCRESEPNQHFDSKASASQWWRARRAEEHPDIATNERRKNTLAKLEAKGLEPLDTHELLQ